MKAIFIRSLFVLFGIFIGLLFAEGVLRTLNAANIITIDKKKSFANDAFVYSSTLKYRIKPYFTRNCTVKGNPRAVCYANKYGHRDADRDFQKPPNTYRILLVGDSLTYGPGVNSEDSYPRIFERILKANNKTKMNLEVINMGMIFYGPAQYYNLYQEFGEKYNPDLIILGYHLLTDPYEAYEYNENQRFYFLKSLPDIVPYSISQPLKEHSYVWRTVLSAYYGWANRQEVKVEETVFQGQKNRYQYDTQLTTSSPFMRKGWELSEYYVDAFVKEASVNGSKVVIVSFPSPAQIIPDEWKAMRDNGQLSDKKLYTDSATRKKFLHLCAKHTWTCLDLQNELRKAEDPKKLFLIGDIHLTKEGNTLAATAIYKFLKNKSIIN